jgi:hypothetical protein
MPHMSKPVTKMPSMPKIHPAANIKTKVRFPDSGGIGADPAVQTPVGRI